MSGVDRFRYLATDESAPGAADTIRDFRHGQDVVDLSQIDANTEVAGDQPFSFVGGAAFSGVAGELRYAGGVLTGDVDGDRTADFAIVLANAAPLTAADFLL